LSCFDLTKAPLNFFVESAKDQATYKNETTLTTSGERNNGTNWRCKDERHVANNQLRAAENPLAYRTTHPNNANKGQSSFVQALELVYFALYSTNHKKRDTHWGCRRD